MTPEDPAATRRVPPGRYAQRGGRPRGLAIVVIGALFAALVGYTVWSAALNATPDVSAGVRSFKVLSDTAVEGTIEVHKGATKTALCDIKARDKYGAQAGLETMTIGPDPSGSRRTVETFTLHTTEPPVTFEIQSCRLAPSS